LRKADISRKTRETDITVSLVIDGNGESNINTGIGFFDHMLDQLAKHGLFDLGVKAVGDLNVDAHHTVEDVGIIIGQALKDALGDKKSIKRYGTAIIPMDEALAMVSVDLGGRPFLGFDVSFNSDKIGDMDTQLFEEFFRALVFNAGITAHIKILDGKNDHHKIEAVFKAFSKALDEATKYDERINGVMSTKGVI